MIQIFLGNVKQSFLSSGYKPLPRCEDLKPYFSKSRFIKGNNVLTNSAEVPMHLIQSL